VQKQYDFLSISWSITAIKFNDVMLIKNMPAMCFVRQSLYVPAMLPATKILVLRPFVLRPSALIPFTN
jgi:hypothetical protein